MGSFPHHLQSKEPLRGKNIHHLAKQVDLKGGYFVTAACPAFRHLSNHQVYISTLYIYI